MSKSVKITEDSYQELQDIGRKKETFAQTVQRVILAYRSLERMSNQMHETPEYQEWKRKQEAEHGMPTVRP